MIRPPIPLLAVLTAMALSAAARAADPDEPAPATPESSPQATPGGRLEKTPEEEGDEGGVVPPEARDLSAELDQLRLEVERLRERLEPEPPAGEDARHAGLRPSDLAARAPERVRLGGVATLAAVAGQDLPHPQFAFPRMALFAFAPVGDRVSFGGEVTFLGGGADTIDADRGIPGRGDVFVQYAAADWIVVPDYLVVRGGIVAVPLGRANLLAEDTVADLYIRPAEALWLVPTPWTDAGGGLLGGAYLGGVRLEWQVYLLSGPSGGIDALRGLRTARQPPGTDRNDDKAVSARVTVEPVTGLELGLSGYSGAYSAGGGRRVNIGAVDAALDLGAILLEGELVHARTGAGLGSLGLPIPRSLVGGSTRVTWRFLPSALGAALPVALQDSSIGVSVRYSFADTDTDDHDRAADATDPLAYTRRDRLDVGIAFRPVARFALRAEYEVRTEAGSNLIDDDRAVLSASVAF